LKQNIIQTVLVVLITIITKAQRSFTPSVGETILVIISWPRAN